MKNTINKIILFAAVLFAAGISQNAAAVGYYIDDGAADIYTASGFPDATEAENAAVQFCVDNSTNSEADCRAFDTQTSFENSAIAYESNYSVLTGATANDAYNALLDTCVDFGDAADRNACSQAHLRRDLVKFCGDGTAEDLTDGCDVRFMPPTPPPPPPPQNPAAGGYYINVGSFTFTAADYPNAAAAEAEAIRQCEASPELLDSMKMECPTTTARGTFTNEVVAFVNSGRLPNGNVVVPEIKAIVGRGADRTAAYNNYLDLCVSEGIANRGNCMTALPNTFVEYCGEGTAADLTDDCDARFMPPNCDTTSTTYNAATGECECNTGFMEPVDTTRNPQTCEPIPPTCDTTTTELNTGTNMCDCRTGFSGRVSPTMCERNAADCTGATPVLFNGICVAACESDEARNSAGNCVPNPANCGANAITNPDDNTNCICVDDMHRFVAGSTTACEPIPANPNTPTCEEHQMLNSSNECVNRTAENCGNAQVFEPASGGGGVCTSAAMFLSSVSFISPTYTAESCENARWAVSIAINNEKTAAAEVCGIPVVRDDTADDSETAAAANAETAAAAESVPLQFPENENANGCIIRESADFLTLPDCNDSQLFGNIGFPQMPENFNIANDRLTVAFVADGENQIFFNGENITDSASQPPQPPIINSQTQTAEQDNEALEQFGYIGAGAIAVVAIATFIEGGGFPSFDFSPDFGYRITESGYAANIGGRADFRKDNWHLYYFANQTNNNGEFGDFRYTSGGKYTGDFWAAAFSESVAGETAKYDFSLSADVDGSLIALSPVYRLHSFYDKGKTETRNELNLQGEFRYNGWTIRPAAGFRWENENDFSDNGRFQMNAVYRF